MTTESKRVKRKRQRRENLGALGRVTMNKSSKCMRESGKDRGDEM